MRVVTNVVNEWQSLPEADFQISSVIHGASGFRIMIDVLAKGLRNLPQQLRRAAEVTQYVVS